MPKDTDTLCLPEVAETILLPNYPNPFDDETNIEFLLQGDSYVKFGIFDLTGIKVIDLTGEDFSKGPHSANDKPKELISNVYFYILEANDSVFMEKMTFI